MKINFHNNTNYNIKKYKRIIKKALKKEMTKKHIIEVIIVNEDEIKEINNYYRNINEVTDVLSFPSDIPTDKSLGDIFICYERAMSQAEEYGHSDLREFAFLAVHGYLHLIGYDHQTKEEETIMFNKQKEILKKAKIERK